MTTPNRQGTKGRAGDRYEMLNGRRVIRGWPEKVEAAQKITTYRINGREHPRIPWGLEGGNIPDPTRGPCGDCALQIGQLHVPSCDVEQCPNPRCGAQAISCGCGDGQAKGNRKGGRG